MSISGIPYHIHQSFLFGVCHPVFSSTYPDELDTVLAFLKLGLVWYDTRVLKCSGKEEKQDGVLAKSIILMRLRNRANLVGDVRHTEYGNTTQRASII